MNDATDNPNKRRDTAPRFDRTSIWAGVALVALLVMLVTAGYGRAAGWAWLRPLPGQRWPDLLAEIVAGLALLLAIDLMRPKNVAWRLIRRRNGGVPDGATAVSNYGAGRGRLAGHSYWGLRCFGSKTGLTVVRMLSPVNRPLFLPWSAIAAVEAYPYLLTGKAGFETDLEARIELRREPSLEIELPWPVEFRQLLPQGIRYRSIKRSDKGRSPKPRRQARGGRG